MTLKAPKKCAVCGKVHTEVPETARPGVDELSAGFWWECDCKSTLFVKPDRVKSH